ncbi:MAG: ATP-grasp domain-containing protein, partial [Acidimicrobiia bacterium]|nr:ATP-grasp domain-containing protein [Acidimicrobiia bacterium]
ELNHAHGTDMKTIALHTEPDRRAMFVRQADIAHNLGSATFTDVQGNSQVSYLDYSRLERALVSTRADAAWVGWGFVAEHAEFAAMCDRLGVTFIGPSAEVIRRLGDKISSKQLAESSNVPVAPWSGGAVGTIEDAQAHAARLGYPLLVKATAGGGGRGIRRVESNKDLEAAFRSAQAEALNGFGDETVFLETLMPRARHIEVQIVGDSAGTVWPVGVRDCSVQRKNQKILEEAPSPALNHHQDCAVREAAARIGVKAGYENAGTVEFLFDPGADEFWFMEVNARLQVEHPVTELTTGLDLVKLQLYVARGGLLEGDPPPTVGHAIEARVNAEDPEAGFAPTPGRIELLRLPTGPGLRIDSGVEEGDDVAAEFDSMIAKVIAVGRDRPEALARLRRGLANTTVVLRNGTSNKAFLQALLTEPDVASASADVGWVDRRSGGAHPPVPHANVAIAAAAIDAHREQMAVEIRQFRGSALRGRPDVDVEIGRTVSLRYRGQEYTLVVYQLGPAEYRIDVDGWSVTVRREGLGRAGSRLAFGDRTHRILSTLHGVTHLVEVDGRTHRITHDEGGILRSPAPAVVVSIEVEPGAEIAAGDRLAVIEAMKMETAIEAEFAGVVEEVLVGPNAQVGAGAPLLIVRPTEGDRDRLGDRVTFDGLATSGEFNHDRCRHHLDALRQLLLGFDIEPHLLRAMATAGVTRCPDSLEAAEIRAREEDVLTIFSDIAALFRREPGLGDDLDDLTRRTTEEYLFDYLRRPESGGRELPDAFVDQLERTLTHFGVDGLAPTNALDAALFRIVVSQRRMQDQVAPLLEVLENRLEHADSEGDASLRLLLGRVIGESRDRYPAVHDLAYELSYRLFDEPFLDEIRNRILAEAEAHLAVLDADSSQEEQARSVEALVECPQPLMTLLSNRFAEASPRLRRSMVEVMTRRYYRIRNLENLRVVEHDGLFCSSAEYDHEGGRVEVIGTHVSYDDLEGATQMLTPVIDGVDPDHDVVLDLYVWREGAAVDADRTRDHVAAILRSTLGHFALRRIVVAISDRGAGAGMSGALHVTFRPDGEGGYREVSQYRNMHPMMGKRLELWRLDEFDIERVSSPEDVYVFHGRARGNPRDERLFALAEVRDLTPVRDEAGELVRLPEAERVIQEVLGVIRRFQAHRPARERLQSNRVVLYVWPTVDLTGEEMSHLVERLAPDADGLGLQKVEVLARIRDENGEPQRQVIEATDAVGGEIRIRVREPSTDPIRPLGEYEQKVARLRQRGLTHPYEIIRMIAPQGQSSYGVPMGMFTEFDLEQGRLVPVDRAPGENDANIVVGIVSNMTPRYPEGVRRVIILGDPSRGMGNLAEPECRRIIAAFELATELELPVEWFAVSAGALISMESGTENMDWIASVLRRIIEFTQAGGEVNVIVTGINVGAQPYWNAEATMLMHTRGILIMMPDSAMVLTGKDALDFSGGVSAEDNTGIGGYERIMGPNGQAQYFARDLTDACRLLMQHYEYTYVSPGERFARPADTRDPVDRDVGEASHGGQFATVGEVFDEDTNPGRKQPFEIRRVMAAAVDQDHPTLERWYGMRDAEIVVVWDAFMGGRPISIIGFESKNLARPGFVPADGPDHWTSGTLFPVGSRKVARAINAASGNRPLVVLANLSGFDGSPESMRRRQLEFGAEIGRAVVNFDGPLVFCVVSRYHGGAFVVFSVALNDNLEVAAIEGSHASVIGGAPAAAVVFARDVKERAAADSRVRELEALLAETEGVERVALSRELDARQQQVHAEKLGEVAAEFDARHDIGRAKRVGSVNTIIAPDRLRPYLIEAIERGIERAMA